MGVFLSIAVSVVGSMIVLFFDKAFNVFYPWWRERRKSANPKRISAPGTTKEPRKPLTRKAARKYQLCSVFGLVLSVLILYAQFCVPNATVKELLFPVALIIITFSATLINRLHDTLAAFYNEYGDNPPDSGSNDFSDKQD